MNAQKDIEARTNERIQHIFDDPYIVYHQTINDYGMLNKHYKQSKQYMYITRHTNNKEMPNSAKDVQNVNYFDFDSSK